MTDATTDGTAGGTTTGTTGTTGTTAGAPRLDHVVVVGASLAGLRACETLRTDGFAGRISLVGAEQEVPYDRPPLSKKLLAGEWEPDRIRLRKSDDLVGLGLDLVLGVRATGLDADRRTVALDDGRDLVYDGLVIATGAAPRRLPGQPELDGVCELRTIADALDLRARIAEPGTRLVVIGAGFIGLEVAATARGRGCTVTVLEGAPSPLGRGLGVEMGAAVASVHTRHDVELRCGVRIDAIVGVDGRVTGVRLADGTLVGADVVVVGIGVSPSIGWLEGSGLELGDGIVCDDTLHTGAPGVYAAGDCARWHNHVFDPHDDAVMRVEHWTNAAEQGAHAARNLLRMAAGDTPLPYEAVPFFWSDQFESRIQFVGRPHGGDEVHVFAGSTDGSFAALYGWEGRLRGVLGVSMPKMVMPFRGLLAARASWDDALDKASALTG
jgi:NADPH-dependent 2,4-dienoyl-CoA reductase/sulfur reductase-like enzyme